MNRRRWARCALAAAVLGGAYLAAGADEFLYYVEGSSVVITNTPSRADVKPLPGWRDVTLPRISSLPSTPYDRFIERVADENGLSPDLIKAVAWVESGFDPRAVSRKGALGLMQLMPVTAERYGVDDPFDPYENLRAGARHLRDLLDEFSGDVTLALAAYNAGSGAVRRHQGIPAYQETREYVRKVSSSLQPRRRRASSAPSSADNVELIRRSDGTVLLAN